MSGLARQSFLGEVIKLSSRKTVKVRVAREQIHPIVQKPIVKHKNYLVHDPKEKSVVGDIVQIDSLPSKIGKQKNFVLADITIPAARYIEEETGQMFTQKQGEAPVMKPGQYRVVGPDQIHPLD
ncbi:hypothetical protein BJ742DRAFT_682778 [Cladochytrium replicatum]|nr:hypothetical protein BJ742DRAFT_682778 [Cladochytrium replicatum]